MRRRKNDSGEVPPATPLSVRVLIVEDDDGYRTYLRTLVRRLGCTAVTAVDGADALQKLGGATFDLLLSDLEMPKLNGLDLIAHVRVHPTAGTIYAVMITSRGDEQSKVAALTRGFDDFLPKSCSDVEVSARIAAAGRLLARHRALDAEVLRWRTLAERDELTQVATRRTFAERTREKLVDERDVAVVMLDLDGFKEINDTNGHLAGDRILRDVGALFLSRTRRDDVVARYGGDEFVFLIADVTLEEATVFADRLTSDVAQLSWLIATDTIRITATAGIAHSTLLAPPTVDLLLDAADRDLYAKKFLMTNPRADSADVYEYPETEQPANVVSMPSETGTVIPMAAKNRDE